MQVVVALLRLNTKAHHSRGTSLKLPPNLLEHKTLMIALILIARYLVKALKVDPDAPLTEICGQLQANRTSVYEQAERILGCLQDLAGVRPGRPLASHSSSDPQADLSSQRLTIQVLDFQIEHPGSVVPQNGRTYYAPVFQRFILSMHDQWQGSLAAFAAASRVPLDTISDWIHRDRQGILPQQQVNQPQVNQPLPTPQNASQLVRDIAKEWRCWHGATRHFFRHAAEKFHISIAQVERVLRLLGAISRRPRKPFRFRGETHALAPGNMLVTDGKHIDVLLASDQRLHFNWQAIVDQATGCDTAVVVNHEECAAGVAEAFKLSAYTALGGAFPHALLHDGKPCYSEASLVQLIQETGCSMIKASPYKPENKAIIEGAFGLYEQRVGTIQLDDSSTQSLVRSAVQEIIRAYTSATNSVPRIELDGKSRLAVLSEFCPSLEQQQRDLAFLERLKADHDRPPRRPPDPSALVLLDTVFHRLNILDLDPDCSLRRYLASFDSAAIRRAAAVVANKLARSDLDLRYVHRYLTKLVQSFHDEIDLERAADELLILCQAQNESWTCSEQRDLQLLYDSLNQHDLTCAIAENAAHGGIPLKAAFWKNALLDLLTSAPQLIATAKKHLIRLFEAPFNSRLALIDLISALQTGLV